MVYVPEVLFRPLDVLMGDRLFDLGNTALNQGNALRPFAELAKRLSKDGIAAHTVDCAKDLKNALAVFFIEVPRKGDKYFEQCLKAGLEGRMHLILLEPPATRPDNYDKANHRHFTRVFTWRDDLVDGKKYFKNNFSMPYLEGEKIGFMGGNTPFPEKKLLCLVSANKYSSHQCQLYTERMRAIRFMEKNHPAEFSLYGQRWDLPVLHCDLAENAGLNNFAKFLNKLGSRSPTRLVPSWQYPSYLGGLDSKFPSLGRHKFSICYENQSGLPGYVSEKIMDAFLAGNVPVYLGASNIGEHVPSSCFVDKRNFPSYEGLYAHLKSMGEKEHSEYLRNIREFLNSPKSGEYKIDFFIGNVLSSIRKER